MRGESVFGAILLVLFATRALAQSAADTAQDEAVGQSVNYVFATDLGSGVYNLDGRTLQIYRFNWRKELREVDADTTGLRFILPITAGFFDFSALDVISEGPPTRVDSFSVVPGLELDYLLPRDWHVIPYVRAGASLASSSVDGWLYGTGVRVEREHDWHGWDSFVRSELSVAGVGYRQDVPDDEFVRLRQGFDLRRGVGWKMRGHELELGMYAIFDLILDPPTAPVADGRKQPLQAEFGVTFRTRPVFKIWRFDAPRLGFGYRLAGPLSAWHILLGAPF
ncbi:MAG TPA: hypothetical protein VGO61_18395 [Steroidobacteraceae bacterium]|jgi:hypothetical protein|nr:hypothetical protein [Steroidobacteraceae bacterium]